MSSTTTTTEQQRAEIAIEDIKHARDRRHVRFFRANQGRDRSLMLLSVLIGSGLLVILGRIMAQYGFLRDMGASYGVGFFLPFIALTFVHGVYNPGDDRPRFCDDQAAVKAIWAIA